MNELDQIIFFIAQHNRIKISNLEFVTGRQMVRTDEGTGEYRDTEVPRPRVVIKGKNGNDILFPLPDEACYRILSSEMFRTDGKELTWVNGKDKNGAIIVQGCNPGNEYANRAKRAVEIFLEDESMEPRCVAFAGAASKEGEAPTDIFVPGTFEELQKCDIPSKEKLKGVPEGIVGVLYFYSALKERLDNSTYSLESKKAIFERAKGALLIDGTGKSSADNMRICMEAIKEKMGAEMPTNIGIVTNHSYARYGNLEAKQAACNVFGKDSNIRIVPYTVAFIPNVTNYLDFTQVRQNDPDWMNRYMGQIQRIKEKVKAGEAVDLDITDIVWAAVQRAKTPRADNTYDGVPK